MKNESPALVVFLSLLVVCGRTVELGGGDERIKIAAINYDVTSRNLLNKIKTLLQLFVVLSRI